MNHEDGGKPHITIGELPGVDERVDDLWILVCVMPDGGEGVYGQTVGTYMVNFIATDVAMKDAMEKFLRESGTIEVCRRQRRRLEWRRTTVSNEGAEVIT